jgi:type II secretory ATPase GspE/PulE/Tfp pilus assembly ATPase PilB-like protein
VTAQRLVRRICTACKKEVQYDSDVIEAAMIDPGKAAEIKFFSGEGCDICDGTGYRGRQGLYEVMPMTAQIRRLIMHGESADVLKERAVADGMLTLRDDGMIKIARGVTTLEEVLKETAA